MVTSRPAGSVVKMQSSTLSTTEASRCSLVLRERCMAWKDSTSSRASPLEIVKRSSMM